MKKIIVSFIMLLVMTASSFAGPSITITIEFGHHDATGVCVPRGLCKITLGGSLGFTTAINDNTGNLEMTFAKSSSQISNFENNLINGLFDVPVAYSLPADVCARLGVTNYTVKAGKYKVVENEKQYTVVFSNTSSR